MQRSPGSPLQVYQLRLAQQPRPVVRLPAHRPLRFGREELPYFILPWSVPTPSANGNFPKSFTKLRMVPACRRRGSGAWERSGGWLCPTRGGGWEGRAEPRGLGCTGHPAPSCSCWERSLWKRTSTAGTRGSNADTQEPGHRQHPAHPTLPISLFPSDFHLPTAALAGEPDKPTLLQLVPTALVGDGPSHGRSRGRAHTQRHGRRIAPGHAAFREQCGQGGGKLQILAGRCRSASSPMPIRTRGRGNRLSGAVRNTQICFVQQRLTC